MTASKEVVWDTVENLLPWDKFYLADESWSKKQGGTGNHFAGSFVEASWVWVMSVKFNEHNPDTVTLETIVQPVLASERRGLVWGEMQIDKNEPVWRVLTHHILESRNDLVDLIDSLLEDEDDQWRLEDLERIHEAVHDRIREQEDEE